MSFPKTRDLFYLLFNPTKTKSKLIRIESSLNPLNVFIFTKLENVLRIVLANFSGTEI